MFSNFYFIQGVGILGTILFFLSFQCKNNRNLFKVQVLSYISYTTHLFLLGAITGAGSYVLNLVRSICLASNNKFLRSNRMCYLLCFFQVLVLIFTYKNIMGILPVIGNIATTIGGYTNNPRKIRIAGIFINSPLWFIYDVYVGSIAGIFDEVFCEASMLISIYRYGWKNLDRIDN